MARNEPLTEEFKVEWIKNFRPFRHTLKIPDAGICDQPCTVYSVNNDWRKYFLGVMEVLAQPDIWDSTDPDEIFAVISEVKEFMGQIPCGCSSAGSTCANCLAATITLHLHLEELYDVGGLPAVAPDAPDTFFDEDSGDTGEEVYRRQLALCWAVHDYIITVVEIGILHGDLNDVALIANAGLIAYFLSPLAGLVYTLTFMVAEQMINIIAAMPEHIEAVACCMLEGLQGKAITEANFAASLDNCGFTPLTDEWIIAGMIAMGLDDVGNYLTFVKALGAYMQGAGVLGDCPCTTIACQTDFTIDRGGWAARGGQAVYLTGIGWDNSPGGAYNHNIQIQFVHDEDWNCGLVRILLVNEDPGDTRAIFRLRDEFDTTLQSITVVMEKGQNGVIAQMDDTIDFRTLHLTVKTTDFPDDNIGVIIHGVDVITGDCVFPEQPVP